MKRLLRFGLVVALLWCLSVTLASTGKACGAGSRESADPKLLIAQADVIVRAVAMTYRGEILLEPDAYRYEPLIEFKVLEILKGEGVPKALHIWGGLSIKDDFNMPGEPFNAIRPSGAEGSCYAYRYKKDGEFLLFLKRSERGLTPYWASMAPANQQLRSADDPWLLWVRNNLGSAAKKQ